MELSNFFILAISTILILFTGLSTGPGRWIRAVYYNPGIACALLLLYSTLFISSSEQIQSLSYYENTFNHARIVRGIVLLILFGISSIMLVIKFKAVKYGSGILWTAGYIAICFASTIYSADKIVTFFKSFELLTALCVMLVISKYLTKLRNIEDFIGITMVPMIFMCYSALAGALILPGNAIAHQGTGGTFAVVLQGVYPLVNSNTLTEISGILFVIVLHHLLTTRAFLGNILLIIIMTMFLATTILAHSRTSLIAAVIGVIFVFIRNGAVLWASLTAWLSMIVVLCGPLRNAVLDFCYRGQNQIVFSSLSGRTEFWPKAWEKVSQSPLWGHGFYAAQRTNLNVSSVDNTYLEVLLGVGGVGLTFFILGVFGLGRSLLHLLNRKLPHDDEVKWHQTETQLGVIFIFIIIRSLTGPSFQVLHINLILFLMLQITITSMNKMLREHEQYQENTVHSQFLPVFRSKR